MSSQRHTHRRFNDEGPGSATCDRVASRPDRRPAEIEEEFQNRSTWVGSTLPTALLVDSVYGALLAVLDAVATPGRSSPLTVRMAGAGLSTANGLTALIGVCWYGPVVFAMWVRSDSGDVHGPRQARVFSATRA